MKTRLAILLVCGTMITVAGCQRLSGNRNYAAPLPATPTTPVGQEELQPLDPNAVPEPATPTDPNALPGTDGSGTVAQLPEPDGALDLGRSDMLGGWKLSGSGDSCMLFMTLTTWTGGYRANTRGCNDAALSGISAWDLAGKQVVLKDGTGSTVAQLYATSAEQFNGQTVAGAPVSLFR